ncbi:KpsF/GutQ family sugar-phosphate isomerase [Neptuniibacter pectenicola]|uniref:Arabinose 5-phosphate isomerase n=1 Tax=Neptuniibacter pectenicola TaxID=1806669 RepID=A0ABU9TW06_9GAMM
MDVDVTRLDVKDIIKSAQLSMQEQGRALISLAETLDNEFIKAVEAIFTTKGRLVISGMGKSGHIGKKIAASLASTGTRAFFMHPGEAFHGDLGMVAPEDIVLLISNSGESDEILKLIPPLKKFGNKIVGMHGNPNSTLGKNSDINLIVKVSREVCPLNLAPTTSTLAAMAMGDALTVALMNVRGFKAEDFAKFHPGGSLGRKLLNTVKDQMRSNNLPVVDSSSLVRDCLVKMTECRAGVVIVKDNARFIGILTDGDIRRMLLDHENVLEKSASQFVTTSPVVISINASVVEAEELMKRKKVNLLIAIDHELNVNGIFENNVW